MHRRQVLKVGTSLGTALVVPSVVSADGTDQTTKLTGVADPEPPSEQVDVAPVNLFKAGIFDRPVTVPTGDHLDHAIRFVGGTNREAAEFYRNQSVEFSVGGRTVENIDQYFTDIKLYDGGSLPDYYGFELHYVTTPQSPGRYPFDLLVRFTDDGPDRGEDPFGSNPWREGEVVRSKGDYTVDPKQNQGGQ